MAHLLTKLIVFVVYAVGIAGVVAAISIIFAWPTQLLWNAVMPDIFPGLRVISFWQAFGLMLLSGLLIKSSSSSSK